MWVVSEMLTVLVGNWNVCRSGKNAHVFILDLVHANCCVGVNEGKLLSNSAGTGVHQQSISRIFRSVDLSQLVYNRHLQLSVVFQLRRSTDRNVLDIDC